MMGASMYRKSAERWLAGGLVMLGAFFFPLQAGGEDRPNDESHPAVRLVIDYGDGVQKHFTRVTWNEGMTVLDLMRAAQQHPRGITFAQRGRGPTAFLTRIDNLENEGRGRNWTYRINDRLADRSFAVQTVQSEDRVVWRFGTARDP